LSLHIPFKTPRVCAPVPASRKIRFVTPNPNLGRSQRLIRTIRQFAELQVVTSWPQDHSSLKFNIKSMAKLSSLAIRGLGKTGLTFMEITAMVPIPYIFERIVLDYPTPLTVEVFYLQRCEWLRSLVGLSERYLVESAQSVVVPNEMMGEHCKRLGARRIFVVPNYPSKSFGPTVESNRWRKTHGFSERSKIALFTAGWRLREIYGLDLLLKSWKQVEESSEGSYLVIVGPRPNGDTSVEQLREEISGLKLHRVVLTGWQNATGLANWVNSADVCLAPRTPGFPTRWYNDQDSTKIAEYAALMKPIVAAGYARSTRYLLTDQDSESFSEGILKAFEGKVEPAQPHFWEENQKTLFDAIDFAY
jgi:glycosyltransferase involved in cell wall biosynthesis